MKRSIVGALLLLGAVGGCVSTDYGPETGGVRANYGRSFGPPSVPGVQGPYGSGVPMIQPYSNSPPGNLHAALRTMSNNQPMSMIQMHPGAMGPTGMQMPPMMTPPHMPGLPMPPGTPGSMMGPMPGMPMPGMSGPMPGMPMPGIPGAMPGAPTGPSLTSMGLPGIMPGGGVMQAHMTTAPASSGVLPAQFANSSPVGSMFPAQRTQVFISKPANMKVYWFTQGPDGKPNYSTTPLETPGRYNFAQGAIYRLKLTHIPGRPALELYPTLEVVPTSPKTNEFLAHNSVPLEFSEEDFKQVVDRNYIVKVIYLPDPQFQDAAGAGPDEIVSTRLEPGQDPIQEALRRGSILLVVRIGNIDQGIQHSPPMSASSPGGAAPNLAKPPGVGVPPLFQVPFGVAPIGPGGAGSAAPTPWGSPDLSKPPTLPKIPNELPPLPGGAINNGSPLFKVPAPTPAKDRPPVETKTEASPPAVEKKTEADPPLIGTPSVPVLPVLPAPPETKPDAVKPIPAPTTDASARPALPIAPPPVPMKLEGAPAPILPPIDLTPEVKKQPGSTAKEPVLPPLPPAPVPVPGGVNPPAVPTPSVPPPSINLPPLPALDGSGPARSDLPPIPRIPAPAKQ